MEGCTDSRAGLEERGERNTFIPAGDQTLAIQHIPFIILTEISKLIQHLVVLFITYEYYEKSD
jgi:hypothetical protein